MSQLCVPSANNKLPLSKNASCAECVVFLSRFLEIFGSRVFGCDIEHMKIVLRPSHADGICETQKQRDVRVLSVTPSTGTEGSDLIP